MNTHALSFFFGTALGAVAQANPAEASPAIHKVAVVAMNVTGVAVAATGATVCAFYLVIVVYRVAIEFEIGGATAGGLAKVGKVMDAIVVVMAGLTLIATGFLIVVLFAAATSGAA